MKVMKNSKKLLIYTLYQGYYIYNLDLEPDLGSPQVVVFRHHV